MIDTLPHRLMGAYAFRLGIPRDKNPYPNTSFDRADWADGWDEAQETAALGVEPVTEAEVVAASLVRMDLSVPAAELPPLIKSHTRRMLEAAAMVRARAADVEASR